MSHAKLATGHAPSPYLRRCRIPNLGSIRLYEDPLSPEDEFGKIELIKAKMEELTRQALTKSKQNKKDNTDRITTHYDLSTTPTQHHFFHPNRLFEDDPSDKAN